VLSNGGVVSLEPWHDSVDAIVEVWALGQAVGHALAGAHVVQLYIAPADAPVRRPVRELPMGQFARFPGVEIADEALAQLIALSSGGSEFIAQVS
jgi:hypothetical protein